MKWVILIVHATVKQVILQLYIYFNTDVQSNLDVLNLLEQVSCLRYMNL